MVKSNWTGMNEVDPLGNMFVAIKLKFTTGIKEM